MCVVIFFVLCFQESFRHADEHGGHGPDCSVLPAHAQVAPKSELRGRLLKHFGQKPLEIQSTFDHSKSGHVRIGSPL